MKTLSAIPLTPRHLGANGPQRDAFTFRELLVVLAVIALLFVVVLPALARSRPDGQAARCMNNLRQMMAGMLVYAGDHNDFLPPNPDDANLLIGHNWVAGNSGGSGKNVPWHPEYLTDPRRCAILNYIGTNTTLFKCPADERWGTTSGGPTAAQTIPAPRTISMNALVGTVCAGFKAGIGHGGAPLFETVAPYVPVNYFRYSKVSGLVAPSPSRLWVLLDESSIGLNDGAFAVGMTSSTWIDAPGAYHNGAGSFAFADGHFESKKWRSESTGQHVGAITPGTAEEADYLWLRDRTSAAR